MRIVFLTGIWPPDVGGPATHGPDFAALPARSRPRGPRRDDGRRRADRAARAGRVDRRAAARSSSATAQVALRGCQLARARRRRLRDGDLRGRRGRRGCRAAAARREARLRPGVRARASLRPLRAARSRSSRPRSTRAAARAEAPADACARAAPRRSSSRARTSPRSRRAGASTATRIDVLDEPRAAAARVEPRAARAGHVRLRRPADARRRRSPVALAAVAEVPEAHGSSLVGDGPERARARAARAPSSALGDRVRFLGALPRDDALRYRRRRARGAALERLGEPAARGGRGAVRRRPRRRDGRRRRARGRARRRERPARAAGRRRRRSRRASGAARRRRSCATGSPPQPSRRSRRSAATRSTARSRRSSRRRRAERAARALRRPGPADAAARRAWLAKKWDALVEVLRPARRCNAGTGGGRRPLPAACPTAAPRLLPAAAPRGRARDPRAFRPDAIVASDPVRRRGRARRPRARAPGAQGDRRGARRPADVHARSTARPRAELLAPRRRRRRAAARAQARRRDARRLAVHLVARSRTCAACRPTRRASRPTATSRRSPSRPPAPVPERRDGRLRRRARAVQERRRARPRPGGASREQLPDARLVIVGSGSRSAVDRRARRGPAGQVEHHPSGSPGRRRASARRSSRARAAVVAGGPRPGRPRGVRARAGRSSRRTPAASPTSSRDGHDGPPRSPAPTPTRSRPRLGRVLDDRAACRAARRGRPRERTPPGTRRRRSSRTRTATLVDRVARRTRSVKLVFVTQKVDPGHPVLAQTLDLVRALAARVDELAVLCDAIVQWEASGERQRADVRRRRRSFAVASRSSALLRRALPRRRRRLRPHGSRVRACSRRRS